MRNRALTAGALALLLLVPGALAAQGEIGVKGGASFGNISNRGVLPGNLSTRTGGAGGIYLGARAAIIGFGIEGLYAQRGAESDQPIATAETRLDYIDVPGYLKLTIPTPIGAYALAGPQVSFEVRCRTAGGDFCGDNSGRRKTDYAGVIGAGIKLGSSFNLSLEGRYVYGLTDLKLSTVTSSESYKTRSFLLLGSIGF